MASLHMVMTDLYKKSRKRGKTVSTVVGRDNPDGGLAIYVSVETERLLTLALARRRVYPSEQELATVIRKFPVSAQILADTRREHVSDDGRHWIKCQVSLDRAIPV